MRAVQERRHGQRDEPQRAELKHALHEERADHRQGDDRPQMAAGEDRPVGRADLRAQRLALPRLVELRLAESQEQARRDEEQRRSREVRQPQRGELRNEAAGQRARHQPDALDRRLH